jgi:hypothetical protein
MTSSALLVPKATACLQGEAARSLPGGHVIYKVLVQQSAHFAKASLMSSRLTKVLSFFCSAQLRCVLQLLLVTAQ